MTALPAPTALALAALASVTLLGAAGCRAIADIPKVGLTKSSPEKRGYRAYDCTLFNTLGEPAATGTLYLPPGLGWDDGSGYSNKFDGTWAIPKVTLDLNKLPFGRGDLIGYIQGSQVRIDLNPNMADNNIMLTGRLKQDGDVLTGRWMHAALDGRGEQGTFKATVIVN